MRESTKTSASCHWLLRFVCGAVVCAFATSVARGNSSTAAVSVTGISLTMDASDFTLGWGFTVDSSVTVTALGVWDKDNNGLDGSHDVGIWAVTGPQLKVSATVPSGTAGTLIDGFRYVTLATPVPLGPGDYRTGAWYGTDSDHYGYDATGLSFAPGLSSFVTRCRVASFSLAYPSEVDGGAIGRFGPNFLMTADPPPVIPEPFTAGSAILGVAGLGGYLRRRRCV